MKIINKEEYCDLKEFKQYLTQHTTKEVYINDKGMINTLNKQISTDSNEVLKVGVDYYIKFNFVKESVELLNKSMEVSYFVNEILKVESTSSYHFQMARVCEKLNGYTIPLFSINKYYIDSYDYDRAVERTKELQSIEYMKSEEVENKILNTYAGIENTKHANRYILKANEIEELEVIRGGDKYNFIIPNGRIMYPLKTVEKIFDYINNNVEENVLLINMSCQEYLSLSVSDFKEEYKILTDDDLDKMKYEGKPYIIFRGHRKFLTARFKDTGIRLLKFNQKPIYINKKDLDKFSEFINTYKCARTFCSEKGFRFVADTIKYMNLDYVIYLNKYYMTEENLNIYTNKSIYLRELREQDTLHDKVETKIDFSTHDKDSEYPNVRKMILEFCKDKKRGPHYSSFMYTLYVKILDNIKADLVPENKTSNNKLFLKVLSDYSDNGKMSKITVSFMNFLRSTKKGPFDLMLVSRAEEHVPKEPYTSEEFINLLSALLNVIADNNKIKKLYRDWRLSSSFSYVLLHYCLAWRKGDLLNNLPIVNLSLIYNDKCNGEDFIKWLEEGNELTYEQCRIICKSLEEETYRLRKKASKNDMILQCIISDALVKEVGTILCINEANRQIFESSNVKTTIKTDICFMRHYTDSHKIGKTLNEKLGIDVNKILNGNFDNTRMNKGFLNQVRDKAKELNLFAYSYAQMLRSHKSSEDELSETTKIYLDKSVGKSAILAFATGTMGSVAYLLKDLIDDQFNVKTIEQQIEDIDKLSISNYQLEQSTHIISNKIQTMQKEMEAYFKGHARKEDFFKKLLYGQNFVGIEEKTKCLIKIVRDEENELNIAPINAESTSTNNKCPLKRRSCLGCDYMIALRYFIYEFEKKYNQVLTNLENAKSSMDKEIFIMMINNIYVPLLEDIAMVVGYDEIYEIVDLNRLKKLEEYY